MMVHMKPRKVFSNIRLFAIACLLVMGGNQAVLSQESQSDTALASNKQATSQQSRQSENEQGPILRLEDTIRGNKEQPQVLTIVPWQLPVHQRINENAQWQLQVTQLNAIERNAFLRKLAVVNELQGTKLQSTSTQSTLLEAPQTNGAESAKR